MDSHVAGLLHDLHEHGLAHDADKRDRLERLRNLEPDSAQLLSLLICVTSAKKVLELGTSNGYSTVWLAEAVRATGGQLTSVEIDPARSADAANNLERAGLTSVVVLRIQDAAETLASSADAQWDFIFLDAERPSYAAYWPDLQRTLRPGGLLVVDNVLSHADQVAAFRKLVDTTPDVRQALAPTGAGMLLITIAM